MLIHSPNKMKNSPPTRTMAAAKKNTVVVSKIEPTIVEPKTVAPIKPEPALWKKVFWGLMLVIATLIWSLGYEQGFHSDEIDMAQYGQAVWSYFKTNGADTTYMLPKLEDGSTTHNTIKTYGTFFELNALLVKKLLLKENEYEYNVIHALVQLYGILTILVTALLVRRLGGGYFGATLTALLLAASPAFLGHSFTNGKDIPFAFGYAASIYFMVCMIQQMPSIKWGSLAGFTGALWVLLATRPAGMVVVAYTGFFGLCYFVLRPAARQNMGALWKSILKVTTGIVLAYVLTVLIWPTLHAKPLTGFFEVFGYIKKFPQRIPFVFDGQDVTSLTIPKNYLYKILGLTIPLALIIGFFGSLVMLAVRIFQKTFYAEAFLLFVGFFPVMYAAASKMHLYNHWRHFLFVYPLLIGLVGMSIARLVSQKALRTQLLTAVLVLVAMSHPIYSIAKAPEYAYMYYNELSGGHKKAFGNYESDYRQMSIKKAVEWLMVHEPDIAKSKDTVLIATNMISAPYILFKRKYPNAKVKLVYTGYKSRNATDWDYGIFNYFLLPREILYNDWPANGSIFEEKIDGKTVTSVVKRTDKRDRQAIKLMQEQKWAEADKLMTAYLASDPRNYGIYSYAVLTKFNLNQHDEGLRLGQLALPFRPEDALLQYYTGLCWWAKGRTKEAIQLFNNAIQLKCPDKSVYQNLAKVYEQTGNKAMAQKTLNAYR